MGRDDSTDGAFLTTLVSVVIMFALLVFAVDRASASGHRGGGHHGNGHSRSYGGHRGHHRGNRYRHSGYSNRRYYGGYNGWNDIGYGLAVGAGIGIVNYVLTPRPIVVYTNTPRVIVQEPVIVEERRRYIPPPIDYRYHKIIKPEAIWEH